MKLPLSVDGIKQLYDMVRLEEGHTEESKIIINQLLLNLGFEKVRLKRKQKPILELNDNIKNYIKQKEQDIASRIANAKHGKNVKSMDISEARFLIEFALMKFECRIENRHLYKKQIDEWLGYSSRTMRDQHRIFGKDIYNEETQEFQLIAEILNELNNFTTI